MRFENRREGTSVAREQRSALSSNGGTVSYRQELIQVESQKNQRSSIFLLEFLAAPRNKEAFGKFAAKYQPRIKRCCCQRWKLQDADADDLTATILLKFFERDVFKEF